jgi:hypothetical protein
LEPFFRKPELLPVLHKTAVFGHFLEKSKEKMPKNCYGKNRLQRFYGFVALSKYLDFSEIGIAGPLAPIGPRRLTICVP